MFYWTSFSHCAVDHTTLRFGACTYVRYMYEFVGVYLASHAGLRVGGLYFPDFLLLIYRKIIVYKSFS